jgi:hypothetical protein
VVDEVILRHPRETQFVDVKMGQRGGRRAALREKPGAGGHQADPGSSWAER